MRRSTAPCSTDGFALLTGTSLFADNGGCEGGGGTTAVVDNNVFYSLMGQPANGIYVDATTGAQLGTFMADVVPAPKAARCVVGFASEVHKYSAQRGESRYALSDNAS
jgi:hypothetical protein